jgi:hypothetical protein
MEYTVLLSPGIIMDELVVNLDKKPSWRNAREEFGREQGLQIRDWILDAIYYG